MNMRVNHGVSPPPHIVFFIRRLTRKIAGGSRSVLDRASMFARMGSRVSLIEMEINDEPGVAISELRRDRILHPAIRVLSLARLLISAEDYVAASFGAPITPPVDQLDYDKCEEERSKNHIAARHYYKNGLLRATFHYSIDGGARLYKKFGEANRIVERWRYARSGRLFCIDLFDGDTGALTRRKLYVDGTALLADIDASQPLGMGLATGPRINPGVTYSAWVAGRLDEHFADDAEIVIVADGENTSQNILRAMRHPGVRGVSVLHNNHTIAPYTSEAPTKPHWRPFFENLTNVHVMVCLTHRQMRDIQARYPEAPLTVVNHPAARPDPSDAPRDPRRIVFVGRLSAQKQLKHLFETFAEVLQGVPDAELHVFGDGDERAKAEAEVDEKGLTGSVTFHGFVTDPRAAFRSAALTLMTSHYEGLPLTLSEAMSVGTPFVAYNLNYGPDEIIETGVNGVLTPANDTKAAAAAIVDLLKNPDRLSRMSEEARRVTEIYTLERHEREWLDLVASERV